MDTSNKTIDPILCPKCNPAKCYMIQTIDDEGKITYKCPICSYKINPDS